MTPPPFTERTCFQGFEAGEQNCGIRHLAEGERIDCEQIKRAASKMGVRPCQALVCCVFCLLLLLLSFLLFFFLGGGGGGDGIARLSRP